MILELLTLSLYPSPHTSHLPAPSRFPHLPASFPTWENVGLLARKEVGFFKKQKLKFHLVRCPPPHSIPQQRHLYIPTLHWFAFLWLYLVWPWASSPPPSVWRGGGLAHAGLRDSWNGSCPCGDQTRRLCVPHTLPPWRPFQLGCPLPPPPPPERWPAPYFLFALAPCLWVWTVRATPARPPCPHLSPQQARLGGHVHREASPVGARAP